MRELDFGASEALADATSTDSAMALPHLKNQRLPCSGARPRTQPHVEQEGVSGELGSSPGPRSRTTSGVRLFFYLVGRGGEVTSV